MDLPLDTAEVSRLLIEIGQRLELCGEIPFKARAYYTAAENLLAHTMPLADLVAQGKLREVPGVGESLMEKIVRLHKTGTHPTLDYLREQMPASVLDMLEIPGLGPKKVMLLHYTLHISSVAELEEACKAGRLRDCKGLGGTLQKKILESIEFLRKTKGLSLVHVADERLREAADRLAASRPALRRIVLAGALRRGCELVDGLCLVAEAPAVEGHVAVETRQDVRVYVSDAQHYGVALLHATGNPAHLAGLRARAASRGMRLTEKGLWRGDEELPVADEQALYEALRLPFIEPELREGRGEIELAAKGALPALLCESDIRGILHCHTDFSDGHNTLAEMAEAVRTRGCRYFGVADHSQSAGYAGGLKEDDIREQHRAVGRLNEKYDAAAFRVFKGIESDIRDTGALDYPDALLKEFDFIVASIHSRLNLDKQAQTARILAAVANPHTTILGHISGRLLLQREAYAIDTEEVLKACAKHGVVVEINAHPHRLDLDWRWHARALELGCMLGINPDAHAVTELDLMRWGVAVARKGGVPKERVLNCMDLSAFSQWLAARKRGR
ncbi:MAG: PHP domain-containing protein [Planctomycetota bacterium]|nr:PHP domain-containing protein [Planctomycetota bacterium]